MLYDFLSPSHHQPPPQKNVLVKYQASRECGRWVLVKCEGNQLNSELKDRWDGGQIPRLLKSHHVPGSDLILNFNYLNSVYLLWLLSFTLSLSVVLSLARSHLVSVSLPLPINLFQSVPNLILTPTAASSASLANVASRLTSHVSYFRSISPFPSSPHPLHALYFCSSLSNPSHLIVESLIPAF